MTRGRRGIASLIASAALAAVLPGAAEAQTPEPQPGLVEALCPRVVPPDTDCATIAYPGEVWSVAATVPIAEGAEAAYDSLIPEPFLPPEDGRREVGVLMFRLDVDVQPERDIDSDPGEGYAEGSVAIRVTFPAQDGYPYREGWWDLAQPLNDSSQYGAGRGIGLPKYMADAGVRIDPDGTWRARALDWADADQAGGPGSEVVGGGNRLEIGWTSDDPAVDEARADELWTWGQYGEPIYVQTPPYDEDGEHEAAMVKFTPASVVPLYGAPYTPFTAAPDPRLGTATVVLEGEIPTSSLTFSDLIGPGPHTVAGTTAFTRGVAFLTVDNLENNKA